MKDHKNQYFALAAIVCICMITSCKKDTTEPTPTPTPGLVTDWVRDAQNPVLRDYYTGEDYQSASDGHVFYSDGELYMIYSGDSYGVSSIKLAKGNSMTDWQIVGAILDQPNADGTDISKETSFYRRANNGKHQVYYIGYTDGSTYQSQIFLAEADSIDGTYNQIPTPVVPRGMLAGKDVYLITSPSVVEHDGLLHMMFIGWNDSPENVSEVWMMGATSNDDGYTWSDFQLVDTPIGMEGQVTKTPDGKFIAVSTGDYNGDEALYYATSDHPFGPYVVSQTPILAKNGSVLEKDEIIAPQITFDPTGKEYLFYTGADHQQGWWMMLAKKE